MLKSIKKSVLQFLLESELPKAAETDFSKKRILSYIKNSDGVTGNNSNCRANHLWMKNHGWLLSQLLHNDIRLFLRWKVVQNTMVVNNPSYIKIELDELKNSKQWTTRWRHAIRESLVGMPVANTLIPIASGNSIHHVYHIFKYEQMTGCRIENMKVIIEFGGGYGSMCRIIHEMGFKGKYILYDLPLFSLLQRYYLTSNNLNVYNDNSASDNEGDGIFCISDLSYFDKLSSKLTGENRSMFLSTWALSETSIVVREQILPYIANSIHFLIAFQDMFGEVNNIEYFKAFQNLPAFQNLQWKLNEIPHIPNSSYLFGCSQ